MKITIKRNELKTLHTGFKTLDLQKSHFKGLQNVRFTVDGDSVIAEGTNLDEHLQRTVNVLELDPFEFSEIHVPIKALSAIAKGGKEDVVTLGMTKEGDDESATYTLSIEQDLKGRKVTANTEIENASEDWPNLGEVAPCGVVTFDDSSEFLRKYREASKHASTDETRAAINSVCINAEREEIVATSGRTLYLSPAEWSNWEGTKQDMILPVTKAFLSKKVFDGPLTIHCYGNYVKCQFKSWTYTVNLLNYQYPNYPQVIPQDTPGFIKFDTPEAFTGLIESANEFDKMMKGATDDKKSFLTIGFQHHEGRIEPIELHYGKSKGTLESDGIKSKGEEFDIVLKAEYLELAADLGMTKMEVKDGSTAVKFRDETGRVVVMMPMRLD